LFIPLIEIQVFDIGLRRLLLIFILPSIYREFGNSAISGNQFRISAGRARAGKAGCIFSPGVCPKKQLKRLLVGHPIESLEPQVGFQSGEGLTQPDLLILVE
jgi:hypothetical protein